jgi:hypothetical protein
MKSGTNPTSTAEELNAVFIAGQLAGIAFRLNSKSLEHFLDHVADDDFRYHALCRAAIEFVLQLESPQR